MPILRCPLKISSIVFYKLVCTFMDVCIQVLKLKGCLTSSRGVVIFAHLTPYPSVETEGTQRVLWVEIVSEFFTRNQWKFTILRKDFCQFLMKIFRIISKNLKFALAFPKICQKYCKIKNYAFIESISNFSKNLDENSMETYRF